MPSPSRLGPPKRPIDWDKKIGKPATDAQQAAGTLAKTTHSLNIILAYLPPSSIESDALAEGDTAGCCWFASTPRSP